MAPPAKVRFTTRWCRLRKWLAEAIQTGPCRRHPKTPPASSATAATFTPEGMIQEGSVLVVGRRRKSFRPPNLVFIIIFIYIDSRAAAPSFAPMKISLPVAAIAFGILGTQPLGAQFFENFGVPGAAPVQPTEDTASHPIGFQSPYAYFGTTNVNLPNQTVGIATSPSGYNTVSGAGSTTWRTFGDHTTGAGYLLMVNGSTQASGSGPYFYSHTVTGISAGSSFDFSFWAQQALTTVTNFATLQVGYSVNGGTSFSFLTPTNALVNYNAWTQVTASIPSSAIVGASSVIFALFDTSGVANGNAFAVDDISITAVPESGTVFAGVGALCLVGLALQRRLGSRAVQLVA